MPTPRKKRKPNPRRQNGSRRNKLRAQVLAEEDYCGICKLRVNKNLRYDENGKPHDLSPEVDEIVPVSRGGSPFLRSNVQLSHRICNRWKGNKTPEELQAIIAKQQGTQPPAVKPQTQLTTQIKW